jgi:hypothetical protein
LPAEPIALDLADRGVTYQRGVGYALHGEYREPDQIALLAVDLLADVADRLPLDRSSSFNATASNIESEIARRVDEVIDSEDADDPTFGALYDGAIVFGGEYLRLLLDDAIASGDIETADERARAERSALQLTSKELRTSVAARGRLIARVRPYLPTARRLGDYAVAATFLASFDEEPTLRRSTVPVLYGEAGSPGGLDASAIRHLATERWGEARQLKGHPTYRPLEALGRSRHEPAKPAAPRIQRRPVKNVERARMYTADRLALLGDLLDHVTLAEIFSIDLAEANEIVDAYSPAE